jgi:site-specific recombinase XerD
MLYQIAMEKFLLSLEANDRSAKTIQTYLWRLENFQDFVEAKGITHIEDLKLDDLDEWAVSLRRQSKR